MTPANTLKHRFFHSQSMHKYAYIYKYTLVYMQTYIYTCTHAYTTYLHVRTHTYIHIHTHTQTIYTFARMQARLEQRRGSDCARSWLMMQVQEALHVSFVQDDQPHLAPPTLGLHCTHFLRHQHPSTPIPSSQHTPEQFWLRRAHFYCSTLMKNQSAQLWRSSAQLRNSATNGLAYYWTPWMRRTHSPSDTCWWCHPTLWVVAVSTQGVLFNHADTVWHYTMHTIGSLDGHNWPAHQFERAVLDPDPQSQSLRQPMHNWWLVCLLRSAWSRVTPTARSGQVSRPGWVVDSKPNP